MNWLTDKHKQRIREIFEPRYKRPLTEGEVETIAENLPSVLEICLKYKWEQLQKSGLKEQPL